MNKLQHFLWKKRNSTRIELTDFDADGLITFYHYTRRVTEVLCFDWPSDLVGRWTTEAKLGNFSDQTSHLGHRQNSLQNIATILRGRARNLGLVRNRVHTLKCPAKFRHLCPTQNVCSDRFVKFVRRPSIGLHSRLKRTVWAKSSACFNINNVYDILTTRCDKKRCLSIVLVLEFDWKLLGLGLTFCTQDRVRTVMPKAPLCCPDSDSCFFPSVKYCSSCDALGKTSSPQIKTT